MTKPECIYIATRLTADHPIDYLHNLQISIDAGIEVWKKGHYPYIPGLDFILIMKVDPIDVNHIYGASIEWMSRCDAVLWYNGLFDEPLSEGVRKEYEVAQEIGLKNYYSIDEVPEVDEHER